MPRNQAFWTSVILHFVVLLGLFLATIVQAFKPKEPPHVFEMVEPPSEQSQTAPPSPQPPVELPPVELPPVPQVSLPEPAPAPTPVERETPPPVREVLMSAEDFFRENPKLDPQPRRVQPRPSIAVPQIEVPKLVIQPTASNPSPQVSALERSALADYSSRLRSRIDAAWTKPAQLAGVQLTAEVIFDVSASGRISNVRIRSSSGNSAFDQSILAAFRRASSAGATPTGRNHQFRLSFRMRE